MADSPKEVSDAAVAPLAAVESLRAVLGADVIDVDPAARALAGHDIFDEGQLPAGVARPQSVGQLAELVKNSAELRIPLTVRGGGASYTLGYTHSLPGGVVIDTAALTGIDIDEARRTATVDAGVTWASLDAELARRGLRAPFWGPFSGLRASIAGSLSQHAVSLGSALHESSASVVAALEVVDGCGRLLRTNRPEHALLRAYGPDLTGLFLGDCGTLGIKARATLKLMRRPTHLAACAFVVPNFAGLHALFDDVGSRLLCSEIIGLDPQILQGFLGALDVRRFGATAAAILRTANGPLDALLAMLRAAGALRLARRRDVFLCCFVVEGWSAAEVRAKISTVRECARRLDAVEVANALPLALRGAPYLPLSAILAPDGYRWLPTHGVFSFPDAQRFHPDFEAWRAARDGELRALGARLTRMFIALGSTAMVYEPTFYWPDSRHLVHESLAPQDYLARVPQLASQPDVRRRVFELRRELTDLMGRHGAQHLQLGKWYPYLSRQHPETARLLCGIKDLLDPQGILNPGALEFPESTSRVAVESVERPHSTAIR